MEYPYFTIFSGDQREVQIQTKPINPASVKIRIFKNETVIGRENRQTITIH